MAPEPQSAVVTLAKQWVVRGGATKEPQILTGILEEGKQTFVKLTLQATWMCRETKQFYVARVPKDSFGERSKAQHKAAVEHFRANNVEKEEDT